MLIFGMRSVRPPAVFGGTLWIRVCPSFCLSVLLSGSFLGVGSLVFSETQHGVRDPCGVVRDRAGFFEEKKCCCKNGENGLKMGQK